MRLGIPLWGICCSTAHACLLYWSIRVGSSLQFHFPEPNVCRPAVPKLNLSVVGPHLAAGATAFSMPPAAGCAVSKRRRQPPAADPPEGLSFSSSEDSESGGSPPAGPGLARTAGTAGAAAAQQAAEPEQGHSKKARPGMSPPRLVLNCGLYEPGSAEVQLKLSGGSSGSRCGRSPGSFWPVAAGGGTALSFEPAINEEGEPEAAQGESFSEPAGEGPDADDPFSRPAAHDPLLEEESSGAARPVPVPISTACVPASAFCSVAAEVPASGCCSPEPPSAPASGRAAGGASPFGGAPSVPLAMELLQRGALMLSCLAQPLNDRSRADLAEIAASLSRMADGPAAGPASCDRENTRSNGNGAAGRSQAWPGFDPVAFKAEILCELRQELRMA